LFLSSLPSLKSLIQPGEEGHDPLISVGRHSGTLAQPSGLPALGSDCLVKDALSGVHVLDHEQLVSAFQPTGPAGGG
jgi:hypothetical protein